ncbi:MAG: porin [Rhodothermales bacterium]|nr:porin [Rhodothermales bacterium]
MNHRFLTLCTFASVLLAMPAFSQTTVRVSGLAYLDYNYQLSSPLTDEEGENGFGYRRLYLTSDFTISDDFSARARLEANDGSTTAQGKPSPFVKDLYLRWKDSFAEGHDLWIGISSPPSFTVSERAWGYRSLEKTIQDRAGAVSSRDFGVALRGQITDDGNVRYGVMFANNNGERGENDKNKRVYGQLEFYPGETLTITVGGDYASFSDERDNAVNGNALVAHSSGDFTVGVEGFYQQTSLTDVDDSEDLYGISLFGRKNLNDKVTLVARFDRVEMTAPGVEESENFFLGGVALRPHSNVEFIPNVIVSKLDGEDTSFVTGRATLHFRF